MGHANEPPVQTTTPQTDTVTELEQLLGMESASPTGIAAPPQDPKQKIMTIQRSLGNAAARQWAENHRVSSKPPQIQRQNHPPGDATAAPPGAAVAQTWRAPEVFDDVTNTARTKSDAGMIVLLMIDRLGRCRERLTDIHEATDSLSQAEHAGTTLIQTLTSGADATPDLTADDVAQLNIWKTYAETAYRNGLNRLSERAVADTRPLQEAPDTAALDGRAEQIQEQLHQKFTDGVTDSSVSRLQQSLTAINEYKEQAERFVTWGGRIAGWMRWTRASEFLTHTGESLSSAGEGLDALRNIANAAENLQVLFGDRASGGTGLAQFRAAINLIDATEPLMKAVPGLNLLWSGYYAPMTRQIIDALARIFALEDLEARQLTLLEWMQQPRDEGVAPTIPATLMSYFPGGQAVLNFMYALVNGGDASANTAVEDFFVSHQTLFNAAFEQERDQLQTESTSHWYNPFSWGGRRVAPNLMQWVRAHRDTVWAQLYGSLPHNLR